LRLTYIFVFLVFHISRISLAQSDFRDGFIVTSASDTVFGLIDYAIPISNSKFCFFREIFNAEIEKFTPSDIHGFGFLNSNQYVSKQVPFSDDTLSVFLEYLVRGKIDLYYFLRNGRDYYYIEKNGAIYLLDNKEIEIVKKGGHYLAPNQKFTGRLKWILSDSNIPSSKIEKTAYTHNSLIKITQEYHYDVCDDEDCIVYYRPEKKVNDARWRINCGLSVGNSWTKLSMKSSTYREGTKFTLYNDNGLFFHTYRTTESNSNFDEISNSVLPGMFFNISRLRFNIKVFLIIILNLRMLVSHFP